MKQSTLAFAKSPAPTAKRPIVIDCSSEDEEPPTASTSSSSTKRARLDTSHIRSDPLSIAPPPFDLSSALPSVEARVIAKPAADLDLLYFNSFIGAPQRKELFDWLRASLPWYRVKYVVRGIAINTPRFTTTFGCDETGAPLSKYKIKPRPLPPVLAQLKDWVEQRTSAKYNFVLINYYRDGKDSISPHSDDESFLGPLPCIASLSLGGSRDFILKHKTDKSIPQEKFNLSSGDMVVMRGKTQSCWLHSVPKRKQASGRINITFRRAMNTAGTNNYYHFNVHSGPPHRWDADKQDMVEWCAQP